VDTTWKLSWQRARNHEGVTRGARALVALAAVLVYGWWADWRAELMPVLLGVIASALTETDDSWRGRLRAQCLALACFGLMAGAVWAAVSWPWVLMGVMALLAFGITMLGALSERYRAIAFGSLILFIYAGLAAHSSRAGAGDAIPRMLAGAAWYGVVSVLWHAVLPRAPVRYRLAKLYAMLGEYLRLKALLLEPVRDVDLERRRMALALHNGRVVDALNATKESLISRMGRGTPPLWLQTAMHQYLAAQDVHERVSSSHEHYDLLAQSFFHSDVLYRCQRVLTLLGEQALKLSVAIEAQTVPQHWGVTARAIEDMQAAVAHLASQPQSVGAASLPAQSRALRSLQALADNLTALAGVFAGALALPAHTAEAAVDHALFDREPRSLRDAWARLRSHWQLQSPWLRHSLRLSLSLMVGFALMQATADPHGYWILLTIVFVSQPQYAATQTRLMERAKGTAMGLALGWAVIQLFPGELVQAALLVLGGAVFFGARHTRYTLATAAVTTLLLLSFHQMGAASGVISARLLDTVVGCVIAAVASWLVLPSWQSRHWPRLAAQVLQTQALYLREILAQYQGGKCDHLAYRLARRNAHNADAALSNSYSAMLKEPLHVRGNAEVVGNFLCLSHTQLNYLSALGAQRGGGQSGRGQVVVQPPADVVGIGLAPVAPPGVAGVGGIGLQAPVHVHQAAVRGLAQQLAHPGALLGQEAAVFLVATPVFQVDRLVRDVDVAAQDELALGLQPHQVRVHGRQEAKLGLLALLARAAAGEVGADQRQLARRAVKAQLDIAALGVELGVAKTHAHVAGGMPAVDADAGIALFLGMVEIPGQAGELLEAPLHIRRLGLELLHANTIRALLVQPGLHPLGGRRADAIEVEAGELEQGCIHAESGRCRRERSGTNKSRNIDEPGAGLCALCRRGGRAAFWAIQNQGRPHEPVFFQRRAV
jgi:YccS/YhfK family integral membrane protein